MPSGLVGCSLICAIMAFSTFICPWAVMPIPAETPANRRNIPIPTYMRFERWVRSLLTKAVGALRTGASSLATTFRVVRRTAGLGVDSLETAALARGFLVVVRGVVSTIRFTCVGIVPLVIVLHRLPSVQMVYFYLLNVSVGRTCSLWEF